jgi:hypothetical protein
MSDHSGPVTNAASRWRGTRKPVTSAASPFVRF